MRPWTEEQRREQAEKMRALLSARWADPVYAAQERQRVRDLCDLMHDDPAIVAKQRANHRAAMARLARDPAWRARMGYLPLMTAEEHRLYRKLTTNGATRSDALKVMGKAESR